MAGEEKPGFLHNRQFDLGKIFGVAAETLKQMNRRDFSRLFRQKAMELHPDQGGRQRDFIRLSEAYKSIMQTKR